MFQGPDLKGFSQEEVWHAARFLGVSEQQALNWLVQEELKREDD